MRGARLWAPSTRLSWTNYRELLSLDDDDDEIEYYMELSIKNNLTYRELHQRIKNKECERVPVKTKEKLINNEKLELIESIKDPVVINNPNNLEVVKEKMLQKLILENLPMFLKELGEGFSFIDSEYRIKIGNRYNYIDLLLFNYEYNCFVVIELKITELKKEYLGQIEVYMNYVDGNLKKENQNKTIGIIICKENNKYIIKYSSDSRIISRKYILE